MSHTTDDMVFQWDPDVPLVVDENIELPQLQLVRNKTDDCSQVYSTGKFSLTRTANSTLHVAHILAFPHKLMSDFGKFQKMFI